MALVNINFTVLAHAYVLYARALQSRIRGGTFAAPVRPALKSGTAMRTTVKSGIYGVRRTSGTFYAAPATPKRRRLIDYFAKYVGLCCMVRVVRWELILECCVTIHIQNTYPDMRRATLQTHFSTAIIRPCWTRRNHFFGQDNVLPCLKPTKGGRVVLRNNVQRDLRRTSTACTDSWKRQIFY